MAAGHYKVVRLPTAHLTEASLNPTLKVSTLEVFHVDLKFSTSICVRHHCCD